VRYHLVGVHVCIACGVSKWLHKAACSWGKRGRGSACTMMQLYKQTNPRLGWLDFCCSPGHQAPFTSAAVYLSVALLQMASMLHAVQRQVHRQSGTLRPPPQLQRRTSRSAVLRYTASHGTTASTRWLCAASVHMRQFACCALTLSSRRWC
jgi:hypothetical protein